jgi:hypothetical protein
VETLNNGLEDLLIEEIFVLLKQIFTVATEQRRMLTVLIRNVGISSGTTEERSAGSFHPPEYERGEGRMAVFEGFV